MWLAKQTRPDIVNEVRPAARYASKPREAIWSTSSGAWGYVFGTIYIGVTFQRGRRLELVGIADADYARKVTDRKLVPPVGL